MTERSEASALRHSSEADAPGVAPPDFRAVVDSLRQAVIVTDAELEPPGPTILYVNPAFSRVTGYAPEEVIGRSPRLLQGPGTDQFTLHAIRAALLRGEGGQWTLLNQGRDGVPYWAELRIAPLPGADGLPEHFVGFHRPSHAGLEWADVTGPEAGRDLLTGLPDRHALVAETRRLLQGPAAGQLCFVYLAIDHFRTLSERSEPPLGDAVLLAVADILSSSLRRSDALGRLGGEEFGICMPGIRLVEARALAERLRRLVEAQPLATPAGPLPVTCSLGLTMARPGDTLPDLLERADAALEAARQQGGNQVVVD